MIQLAMILGSDMQFSDFVTGSMSTVKPCKMGHGGVTWDKSDFYFEGYISENILDTFMHSFVKVSLEPCLSVPLLPFWVAHTERVKKHI